MIRTRSSLQGKRPSGGFGNGASADFYFTDDALSNAYYTDDAFQNPYSTSGGMVMPLRTASVQNRAQTGLASSSGRSRHVFRWPHAMGSDLSSICVNINNWWINNNGLNNGSFSYELLECSLEAPDGTVVPVYFSGARNIVVAIGETNINSDEIPAAAFGLGSIQKNTVYWVKGLIAVPAAGNSVVGSATVARLDVANSQAAWFDPAVTTVSSTDLPGLYTATGTALTLVTNGYYPIILGRPLVDGPSYIALGDSIGDYAFDNTTNGVYGKAMFQRAVTGNQIDVYPLLNFCRFGSTTSVMNNAVSKWSPYLAYAKYAFEEYGTNDIGTSGGTSAATVLGRLQTLWATLRSGSIQKIIRTKLLPRTTSTDNWATTVNQSYVTGWGIGEASQQLSTLLTTELSLGTIDYLVDMNSVRDGTENLKWAVNGTANLNTTDGTHPSPNGHINLGAELRVIVDGLDP